MRQGRYDNESRVNERKFQDYQRPAFGSSRSVSQALKRDFLNVFRLALLTDDPPLQPSQVQTGTRKTLDSPVVQD